MKFEWDQIKAKTNIKKHGISFLNAALIFSDPDALTIYDEDHSNSEDRWITLGQIPEGPILIVIHPYSKNAKEETIRIISARYATKNEEMQYFNMK